MPSNSSHALPFRVFDFRFPCPESDQRYRLQPTFGLGDPVTNIENAAIYLAPVVQDDSDCMSEAQVVSVLGAADERSAHFRLGQYGGSEKEYARADESGSSYYLLWHKGIDVVYAVGFDKDGQLTMKAVGGT